MIEAYLSEWYNPGQDGGMLRKNISCGVHTSSHRAWPTWLLGPLLWNIGYDWVLRGTLVPGADIIRGRYASYHPRK